MINSMNNDGRINYMAGIKKQDPALIKESDGDDNFASPVETVEISGGTDEHIEEKKDEHGEIHGGHGKHGHHEPLWVEGADISHLAAVALHNTAKASSHVSEGLHQVAETGHGVAHGAGSLLNLSTAAAGLGAVGLIANGVMELKEGKKVAGTSSLLAGTASGSEFVAGIIHSTGILGTTGLAIAEVAAAGGAILGGVHGAIEIGRGAKELYDGVKEKDNDKIVTGSLRTAIGGALITSIVTGGVVPAVAAVALMGAKIVYSNREAIAEFGKKVAHKVGDTWNNIFGDKNPEEKKTDTSSQIDVQKKE